MDLINSRTMDITQMALNGLYERSKAVSSNTANATTPNYQRKDVAFEDQIVRAIEKENLKEDIKAQNSSAFVQNPLEALKVQDPAQIAFMQQNRQEGFSPETLMDMSSPISKEGNNVNIEQEMMLEAKTGLQYTVLTNLMSRSYDGLTSVIKGQ